jgi:hypothetical protein
MIFIGGDEIVREFLNPARIVAWAAYPLKKPKDF